MVRDLGAPEGPGGVVGPVADTACSAGVIKAGWEAKTMRPAREPIFDETDRTDTRPAEHSESTFEFMNRVGGDFWQHPRALMQTWLDRVSGGQDYNDLRQR